MADTGGPGAPKMEPKGIQKRGRKSERRPGGPRGAIWSILTKSLWRPCPFETRKRGVPAMTRFFVIFGRAFFWKFSSDAAAVAMCDLTEIPCTRMIVLVWHLFFSCNFLENRVLLDADFE